MSVEPDSNPGGQPHASRYALSDFQQGVTVNVKLARFGAGDEKNNKAAKQREA
jgi:hypothetical protein